MPNMPVIRWRGRRGKCLSEIYSDNRKQSSRERRKSLATKKHQNNFINETLCVWWYNRALIYSYNIYLRTYLPPRSVQMGVGSALIIDDASVTARNTNRLNWCWNCNRSCWLYSNTSLPCKLHFIQAGSKKRHKNIFISSSSSSCVYCISRGFRDKNDSSAIYLLPIW